METIRAFVAVPLPVEARQALASVSEELDERVPDRSVRWVKPESMHLTLRFLGDTEGFRVPAVAEALDHVSARHQPFDLRLHSLGCFPNTRRPRVIWCGLKQDVPAVQALKSDLDKALTDLGWEPEKRLYQPHITLGRVKDQRGLDDVRWEADVEPFLIPVEKIHLMESKLLRTGAVYTVRHTSFLRPS